jgi:branched-chain amino acid transport system permease protein
VSDDSEVAQLMGIRPAHVYALAMGISCVMIAVGGVLQGMRTTIAPTDGSSLLLYSFEAVIMGGLGSFWGAFAGALVLGLTQSIGFRFDPGWGIWIGHLVFLAVLVARPQGLFPRTRD